MVSVAPPPEDHVEIREEDGASGQVRTARSIQQPNPPSTTATPQHFPPPPLGDCPQFLVKRRPRIEDEELILLAAREFQELSRSGLP